MLQSAFSIPFHNKAALQGKYLFLVGGYHSSGKGCPDWGTSDPSDIRFIGDHLGDLTVTYASGARDTVPLVLGYTLWLRSVWEEEPAPFFGEGRREEIAAHLYDALCLYGAWEGKEKWVLRVELQKEAVVSVEITGRKNTDGVSAVLWGGDKSAPIKQGEPVFTEGYVTDSEALPFMEEDAPDFFAHHTVNPRALPVEEIQAHLRAVCHALHTFDEDFQKAPAFVAPDDIHSWRVSFGGSPLAEIATGVVYYNMRNLCARSDDDGFIHTSYKDAPSWRYDGFGPYVLRANSYYADYYSRDCARAIMTLNLFGESGKGLRSCQKGNELMMIYPRDGVTLGGIPVPGHYSVICNKPYIYSRFLIHRGWPTQYTPERFGAECGNLGNQETDGHGLMMMANYTAWCAEGKNPDWVCKSWEYICEGARWILWCFDHPELSFVKEDLLYGETEAAMNDYTLYANIPCYLGLLGYIEMAKAAGYTAEAECWKAYADRLQRGIDKGFASGEGWLLEKCGFHHEPTVTMLADVFGYDTADMPAVWVERSRNSYCADLARTVDFGWYGVRGGVGYNHSMITQTALLLDQTADADRLVNSLCRICYAPRLPEPYIVPEGMSIDAERGIFRRQGDLGNLVQLAEAMKCYHIVVGVAPLWGDTVKIMPRLPKGWRVDAQRIPLVNTQATVDMEVCYPEGNTQTMRLRIHGGCPVKSVSVRFGPFPADTKEATAKLNGKRYTLATAISGDAAWAWVEAEVKDLL